MSYEIEVFGKVVGKQRPKASSRNGFVRMYTPTKTVNYESRIAYAWTQKYGEFHFERDTALSVTITIYVPIPKAFSKKKRLSALSGEIKPTTKPDIDNVCKSVLDGLNGIAYVDDKQVNRLFATKVYEEMPKVVIEVQEENKWKRSKL